MKKIMFNDTLGLTDAVLNGTKTMTRRLMPQTVLNAISLRGDWEVACVFNKELQHFTIMECSAGTKPKDGLSHASRFVYPLRAASYQVGEIVAIAESYEILANSQHRDEIGMMDSPTTFKKEFCGAGWRNKMFVKAEHMPHAIRITNIKVERLQDVSDEDCLREGIYEYNPLPNALGMDRYNFISYAYDATQDKNRKRWWFSTPRKAFSELIDKVSGKGTWGRNPWVYAYEFELVK